MPHLTITLTDRAHQALKDASVRQGRSMDAIVEESLELGGILRSGTARETASRARAGAGLSDEEAMAIAVRETRLHRTEKEG